MLLKIKSEEVQIKDLSKLFSLGKKLFLNLTDSVLFVNRGEDTKIIYRFHISDIVVESQADKAFSIKSDLKTLSVKTATESLKLDWLSKM